MSIIETSSKLYMPRIYKEVISNLIDIKLEKDN